MLFRSIETIKRARIVLTLEIDRDRDQQQREHDDGPGSDNCIRQRKFPLQAAKEIEHDVYLTRLGLGDDRARGRAKEIRAGFRKLSITQQPIGDL